MRAALRSASLALIAVVAVCSGVRADRLLVFAAREQTAGTVRVAEVTGGGKVLLRLRARTTSVLPRAQRTADVLGAAVLASAAAPTVSVAKLPGGDVALKVGTETACIADKESAHLCSTSPEGLAAGWQTALREVFAEPYVALEGELPRQVPIEEARYLRYGGPLGGALQISSADPGIALAKVESSIRRLKVFSVAPGSVTLTLSANALRLSWTVEARHWAARIAETATAQLTGSGQDERTAMKVAVNAALAAAAPQPGAFVSLASANREGAAFRVGVTATGEGYFDVRREVKVALTWTTPPPLEPQDLLISNAPERISSHGSLLREELIPSRGARLLYHHLNEIGQTALFVVRIANPGREPAGVHVVLGESGPATDELAVGHSAASRFWEQTRTGSGYVLQVPPMHASDVVRVPVPPGQIVSGLAIFTPLTPAPLFVEVSAQLLRHEAEWVEPLRADDYAQPKLTRFRFPGTKVVQLRHEIGGPWTFFSLGGEGSTNEAGTYLAGDYGVLHEIDLEIANPTDQPGWAALDLRASAGLMRGLFLVDGVLHETGMLSGFQQEQLLRREVSSGEVVQLRILTLPESASNYPVHMVVHSELRGQ